MSCSVPSARSTSPMRRHRSVLFSLGAAVVLVLGSLLGLPGTSQAATSQPCDIYAAAGTACVGSDCCFDYGNAESTPYDTGNGHMDAVSIATTCYFAPCQGSGPWIEADMENGMFQGGNGSAPNPGNNSPFVTAVLKNTGQTNY